MLKPPRTPVRADKNRMEIKSKLDAEFRRFALDRSELTSFPEFSSLIEKFHRLQEIPFTICYTDPIHGDLLPINNDDNFARAVNSAWPLLRIIIQKKEAMDKGASVVYRKNLSQDHSEGNALGSARVKILSVCRTIETTIGNFVKNNNNC